MQQFAILAALTAPVLALGLIIAHRLKALRGQVGGQIWLELQHRFNSREMKCCRKRLARQLDPYVAAEHAKITLDVLDFFEEVGTVVDSGWVEDDLAALDLSFYANRWWRAAQPYIDHHRRIHDDDTLFIRFEKLADLWSRFDPGIEPDEVVCFLQREQNLLIN